MHQDRKLVFCDGSRIMIEALASAGASVYIGYPITPANWLYAYASQRFPTFLAAPDEISALQWAAGFSATGQLPVTATSFPGFALMLESLNMAFMMELPLVIILAQRLGPSTGSATTGAQGDLLLLRGAISGGHPLPVLCPADFIDCWHLAARAANIARELRTPVILLTSKEMIMTSRSFDLSLLPPVTAGTSLQFTDNGPYLPYRAGENRVPPFLPVGNARHQVRLNASTHDHSGLIRKDSPESLANTVRLREKIEQRVAEFTFYHYDAEGEADTLVVTYGISNDAAREAISELRARGEKVSLLILKTLLPIPPPVFPIFEQYAQLLFVEENLSGQLKELCFGQQPPPALRSLNKIGKMITPEEIVKEVLLCKQVC